MVEIRKKGKPLRKVLPNVYIVGAQAEGTVRERRTIKNFPKPPTGARMAAKRPPMLVPF